MLKIILAIVLFSVIVIFHELGHFLFAKKNGICVEEFAIGIGPTIFGKQIGLMQGRALHLLMEDGCRRSVTRKIT